MKNLLPALATLALLAAPTHALSAPETPPPQAAAVDTALPAPPKVTRWEDTGMKPAEAREWQDYKFAPQEAMNWQQAGFVPLVARSWSDKGFDADEARIWRDSARSSRTMMADLDHSDPAAWKREGFSPQDRLAWWDAGFVFDDAVLLARAGMTPVQAAWHGQEKLKELRGDQPGASKPQNGPGASPAAPTALSAAGAWAILGPFLKFGLLAVLAIMAGGLAFFFYRRAQTNHKLAKLKPDAPDSEAPPEKPRSQHLEKRKPAREVRLIKGSKPRCVHCKSENVRPSQMHPHRFAGINFTDYFRCRACGRHFAIVSYTPIVLTGGGLALALILVLASFIYLFSVG